MFILLFFSFFFFFATVLSLVYFTANKVFVVVILRSCCADSSTCVLALLVLLSLSLGVSASHREFFIVTQVITQMSPRLRGFALHLIARANCTAAVVHSERAEGAPYVLVVQVLW